MLDPSDLIDNIVTTLQSNSALTALLANSSPASIIPFYESDPSSTNLEQAVQEQPSGTIMICWLGTRTGSFNRMEAIKHDYGAYLKSIGRASATFAALMNGVCSSTGLKFRFSQVNNKVNPVEAVSIKPQPYLIGQGLLVYDMMSITFTLTERGVDS